MTTTQPEQLACFSCGTRTLLDDCPECGGMTGAVISQYTDHDALADGDLVAVTNQDRCTRGLFEDIARQLPEDRPPTCWPIDLLTWCRGAQDGPTRAMSACKGLIGQSKLAVNHADGAAVRRWYVLRYVERDRKRCATIAALIEHEPHEDQAGMAVEMWLLPNEVGGVTLMLPSDY